MEAFCKRDDAIFFIDPPYPKAGKRLYTHFTVDHEKIFQLASALKGNFLMTYEKSEQIIKLANKFNFETVAIQMKNTHHSKIKELVISKDLSWLQSSIS